MDLYKKYDRSHKKLRAVDAADRGNPSKSNIKPAIKIT